MAAFIFRRTLVALAVLVGVATLVFVLTRTFADPARLMLPLEASDAEYRALRHALGLDDPIPIQFGKFVLGALHGDFGQSYWQRCPLATWCSSASRRPSNWRSPRS